MNNYSPICTGKRVLELTQVLFQNKEIDAATKNKIAKLTMTSQRCGDFSELNSLFRTLQMSITLKDILQECLDITRSKH